MHVNHCRARLLAAVTVAVMAGGTLAVAGAAAASVPPGGGGIMIRAAAPPGAVPAAAGINGATKAYSGNWSGYAQVGKNKKVFTAVEGFWTVPTVKTGSGHKYSSDWVGIDGASNTTLIQDGTEADNLNGTASYRSWTEILPAAEVPTPLVIHAGDKMEGIVQEISTNKWTMTVKDLTSGKSYSKTVSYTTPQQDVEAVHERPTLSTGSLANLAATTNVTQLPDYYSTAAPGQTPVWTALGQVVSGATLDQIFMVNNGDTAVIASPSVLNTAQDGFTVADGSKSPPPPTRPLVP